MNHYKKPHVPSAGLKPASVEDSDLVLPVFSPKILFIFSGMAGENAWKEPYYGERYTINHLLKKRGTMEQSVCSQKKNKIF